MASSLVLARTSASTKNVCATGAGLAEPVVSTRIASKPPLRFALHQPFDDADEIAAHGATNAAIVHLEHFFVGVDDQVVIDADLAKFVDDDCVALPVRLAEDAVQKPIFRRPGSQ